MADKKLIHVVGGETTIVDFTADEQKVLDDYRAKEHERKLERIRLLRNQKLQETDWKVTMAKEKGTTLSSGFKTWRDNLRKIPQDYTTETKYNELLARDDDGNLIHSVWSE